jgi:alkylhydroperoxidase/carboxymuconolactone decarboxylase family protein YurZ
LGDDEAADSMNERMDAVEQSRVARGDLFWETVELARLSSHYPDTPIGAYVHQYQGHGDASQLLSAQMRELIATVMLVATGKLRFGANHVRRLYRMGVTDAVILEAFWAGAPFFGRANLLLAVQAIHMASDVSHHEGALPPNGPPTELVDFQELHFGNDGQEGKPDAGSRPWQLISSLDPKLAALAMDFYGRTLSAREPWILPVAARELIAVVVLSWRGLPSMAAIHIARALRCGLTARHVLDALSAAIPMTGLTTLEVGTQAMLDAGITAQPQ